MKYKCTHCVNPCTLNIHSNEEYIPTKCPYKGAGYWTPVEEECDKKPNKKGLSQDAPHTHQEYKDKTGQDSEALRSEITRRIGRIYQNYWTNRARYSRRG